MTKSELVQNVQRFMTSSYGIPIKLSEGEIEERILDAERWFYRYYDRAVESRYYVIPKNYFTTVAFKEFRQVPLPDCVISVTECRESFGASRIGIGDSDLSISRLIAADVFLGSYSSDELLNRVVYASYYDLSKAFIRDWIRYYYNENTNNLILEGSNPRTNIVLKTYVKIPGDALYNDPFFIDYVRGAALQSLGRMTTIITMNLPGGASLNTSELKSEGKQMMDDVKTKIEELQPSNYLEFFH